MDLDARARSMKFKAFIELIGGLSLFGFGMWMHIATIFQWYAPNHTLIFRFNIYNEAFIEYVFALIAFPCSLYFAKVSLWRLTGRAKVTEIDSD